MPAAQAEQNITLAVLVNSASTPVSTASIDSEHLHFVKQPQRLLAIEREFSTGDPVLVHTAVFGLLHDGRINAPELWTQPLSLLTSFAALEAQS
jgi:hypothetical protein